jgi:acetyl-CoA carboxylase biotin carboxyl carrier protein
MTTSMTSMSQHDVSLILKVIDDSQNLDEVELVLDGIRLHVRRSPSVGAAARPAFADAAAASPAQASVVAAAAAAPTIQTEADVAEGMTAVRAPMLGAFYRSPSPGEPPFVQIGQHVKPDDTVCLIEVMKLFNSIKAGVEGEVVQIRVEDGALVEYGEALIVIRPVGKAA